LASATGIATIQDSPETKKWIQLNRPARIIADGFSSSKI
jgi:hypothetical protein